MFQSLNTYLGKKRGPSRSPRFGFKKRFYFEVHLSQTSARFAPCSSLAVGGLHARPLCARQGGACFQSGPEREDSPGKMATAGSADRPGRPASAASGRTRPGLGAGCGASTQEDEAKKCASCAEAEAGVNPPCGHPACPLCLARRHSGSEERLRRKSDPERSSSRQGRRDCDSRRGQCVYRGKDGSHSALTAPRLGVCFTDRPQKAAECV